MPDCLRVAGTLRPSESRYLGIQVPQGQRAPVWFLVFPGRRRNVTFLPNGTPGHRCGNDTLQHYRLLKYAVLA